MTYNNENLMLLKEKVARKKYLETTLKELREKVHELEPQVRKLAHDKFTEQADVDRLENGGLKSFFYKLTGKKDDQIEIERQEAYEARVRYDSAAFELERMKTDLQNYISEFSELKYIETEYKKLLKEKAELVKLAGGKIAQDIAEFDEKIDHIMAKNNELREARSAASNAAAKANEVISKLNEALRLSKKDVMGVDSITNRPAGESRYVDRSKHGKLKEANSIAFDLRKAIQKMDREIADIKEENLSVNVGTMLWLGDTVFDDIFSNISVMEKIESYIKNFENINLQIGKVVLALNEEISENEARINVLINERDELVINAGL